MLHTPLPSGGGFFCFWAPIFATASQLPIVQCGEFGPDPVRSRGIVTSHFPDKIK